MQSKYFKSIIHAILSKNGERQNIKYTCNTHNVWYTILSIRHTISSIIHTFVSIVHTILRIMHTILYNNNNT